jgi:hypothetical protein
MLFLGENTFSSRACRLGPKLKIASKALGTEIDIFIRRAVFKSLFVLCRSGSMRRNFAK